MVTEISGGLTPTIITANLFMPNAEWITEVYLTIRWDGLLTDSYTAVSGSATIPAHMAGELAQALGCLASRASADKKIEITEYVASLTKEAQ